jgi:hemoglobin-like flavoprotein
MTPRQIELVQRSFAEVVPIRLAAAELFYDRLFRLDPSLRPLFRGDRDAQGAKLMAAIATVVRALDNLDTVMPAVTALAQRHVRYGVAEHHYATVGAALLWTLEQALSPRVFGPETREAWRAAYALLSGAMIAAARRQAA